MIKILICDDQELVCEGLNAILGTSNLVEVQGMCYNGLEAIEFIEKHPVDVVLMDLKMPILNGIQATKQIKEKFPNVHILVLTTYDADQWVLDAIRYGADGYLLKDAPRERLLQAIEEVNSGRTPVDSKVAGKIFEQISKMPQKSPTTVGSNLTEREREVLMLISHGKSNAEIAESLYLSEGTVRNYVSSILEKLEVTDRTQAAVIAIRSGLVD
ncbi:MAG TPA: response regulator transcription factor [Anaerolineaceae bacterium]|jgi:DNA-binding NarL/FixJ family response regulator|nr:response regulator transcription factor [Anaerolineaceae bacterium]